MVPACYPPGTPCDRICRRQINGRGAARRPVSPRENPQGWARERCDPFRATCEGARISRLASRAVGRTDVLQGLELLYRTRQAHCTAVWPISGHRLNGVSDHDDSRAHRYVVARHAVGIPRSVEILVMVTNHSLHRSTKSGGSLDQLRTSRYVSTHGHPLFRSQLALLAQERSEFFVDLAHVMKECSAFDFIDLSR